MTCDWWQKGNGGKCAKWVQKAVSGKNKIARILGLFLNLVGLFDTFANFYLILPLDTFATFCKKI
jgi:hypothetical protein